MAYDAPVDVLYLWSGEPRKPAWDDASTEGHYLQFCPNNDLIAVTIVNTRRILEREGKVTIDDVEYDRGLDVLYLRAAGTPLSHAASEEFNPLEFDADGKLVAVTIAEARRLLEEKGRIVVTLPDGRKLGLSDL